MWKVITGCCISLGVRKASIKCLLQEAISIFSGRRTRQSRTCLCLKQLTWTSLCLSKRALLGLTAPRQTLLFSEPPFSQSQILQPPARGAAGDRGWEKHWQTNNDFKGQQTSTKKTVRIWVCLFQVNDETPMVAVLGEDQHSPKYVQTQASQSEVSHLKNNKNLQFTI